jgi:hypothetical protein
MTWCARDESGDYRDLPLACRPIGPIPRTGLADVSTRNVAIRKPGFGKGNDSGECQFL